MYLHTFKVVSSCLNIRDSFARKKARANNCKIFYEDRCVNLENDGRIEFANWENPLTQPFVVTQPMVTFFRKFISKGSLAVDIGLISASTTVPMAVAAGKDGLTLAFDPYPYVFDILRTNSNLNKEKTNIICKTICYHQRR